MFGCEVKGRDVRVGMWSALTLGEDEWDCASIVSFEIARVMVSAGLDMVAVVEAYLEGFGAA